MSSSDDALNIEDQNVQEDIYEPLYNNVHIWDLDLDSIPEKMWRNCRTREDITKYFNYGFDEVTFRMFQQYKQKQMKGQK
ncbi:Fip1 motif-containing protein [Spironucleus salmonicida]|uniref:Fip1 motif-containing protein n=1 Tax=Spironucleus salmonicida TaxID=348837 RepID=V6LQP6_9EUKA|nr:Fip1 motif-containing protein [Spironucleus salmonicida]|eukprot:EST46905.1 Fip1 motif-containing protein [Spironucleus salmonicida]